MLVVCGLCPKNGGRQRQLSAVCRTALHAGGWTAREQLLTFLF